MNESLSCLPFNRPTIWFDRIFPMHNISYIMMYNKRNRINFIFPPNSIGGRIFAQNDQWGKLNSGLIVQTFVTFFTARCSNCVCVLYVIFHCGFDFFSPQNVFSRMPDGWVYLNESIVGLVWDIDKPNFSEDSSEECLLVLYLCSKIFAK